MMKESRKGKGESGFDGTWKQFLAFFKHSHLSWGWIVLSMALNMTYYLTISKIPGSTAALFAGKFTTKAIMDAVMNYSLTLLLLVVTNVGSIVAQAKSVRSVRKAVWTRMMGIRTSFYDKYDSSKLLSAVTSDTETAVATLMTVLVTIPGLIFYLMQALPIINEFSPKLLWAILVLIPFYILYAIFMGRWQFKVGMRIQVRIGGLTGYLTDRIRNLTMIKSFATEEVEEEKGIETAQKLYKGNMDFAYVNSVVVAYTLIAEIAGVVIAVILGCALPRTDEIDLQSWLTFYLFAPTINTVFRQLTTMWSNLKDVQGRVARLGMMMEAPQENMNENAGRTVTDGDIVFENVTFSYVDDIKSLHNINLVVPKGKMTAIVGHSGSGKTTILRLIERLYDPQEGKIKVNDISLKDFNLPTWRGKLSYVSQGADLFGGTIREALTYGIHRDVSDEEIEAAVRKTGIYDFIMQMPDKYDSKIAIWGNAMSGGQRQRMVIARELLKDADILLLDEPTSALDAETASTVSQMIFESFRNRTIIAVTHEIGLVTHADQIIVMSEGEVVGAGAHDELMRTNPLYRSFVEEQSYQEVFGS